MRFYLLIMAAALDQQRGETFAAFIYLQTASDGRPRPEEIIGNAKVNKNRDTHTHTYKTLQTGNTVDGEVVRVGAQWRF